MKIKPSTFFVIAASIAFASTSLAQRGDFRGGQAGQQRGGFSMSRMMTSDTALLARPDVQKDIKLTDKQKTDIEAIRNATMEEIRAMFTAQRDSGGGSGTGTTSNGASGTRERPTFDRTKIEAIQKESDTKIKAVLTPEQTTRLGQIRIQLGGARIVIDDEDISKQLGLKATQKLDINKLIDSESEANQKIFMRMREDNADRDALLAEVKKNDDLLNTEIAKILTADQKKKLDDMKGPKFEADPNYRPFGNGRGGGFGGGGGGFAGRRGGGGSTGGGTGGGL